MLTVVARSAGRRRSAALGCRRSRLPLVRPSRSLLRTPPGTRARRATRGRVSRPGGTGSTSRRLTTVAVTIRYVRHRSRRRTATTGAVAAAGTTPTITGVAPSTGPTSRRCVPHCLLVVLQHLGHGCLHGSAGFLALLAQLAAQEELAGTPAPAALAAWCAERQLAATSPAS